MFWNTRKNNKNQIRREPSGINHIQTIKDGPPEDVSVEISIKENICASVSGMKRRIKAFRRKVWEKKPVELDPGIEKPKRHSGRKLPRKKTESIDTRIKRIKKLFRENQSKRTQDSLDTSKWN